MAEDERRKSPAPERTGAPAQPGSPAADGPVATTSRTAGLPADPASGDEVADFIRRMRTLSPPTGHRGRLVFAMDATMSRQPTWDMALGLQAEMFEVVREVGHLDVQLVFFRGNGECRASKWVRDPGALARLMTSVDCRGGFTQIGKVLRHTAGETERAPVAALVFVGDAMEEKIDDLCGRAGELALLGVPAFLFQEGTDAEVARAFREIARITKGAYCRFNAGAADELRALLRAVAVYAAGGRQALARLAQRSDGATARRLLADMKDR